MVLCPRSPGVGENSGKFPFVCESANIKDCPLYKMGFSYEELFLFVPRVWQGRSIRAPAGKAPAKGKRGSVSRAAVVLP